MCRRRTGISAGRHRNRLLWTAGGEPCAKGGELTFQQRDALAKLIVIKFHEYTGRLIRKLCQHRTLVVAEIVTTGMRPVERNRQATQLVTDRDGNDRPH